MFISDGLKVHLAFPMVDAHGFQEKAYSHSYAVSGNYTATES